METEGSRNESPSNWVKTGRWPRSGDTAVFDRFLVWIHVEMAVEEVEANGILDTMECENVTENSC